MNEARLRQEIQESLNYRRSRTDVDAFVNEIRKSLPDEWAKNTGTIELKKAAHHTQIWDEYKGMNWFYKVCKKINKRFRKLRCYDKYLSPIVERIKCRLPVSMRRNDALSYREFMHGTADEFIQNAYLTFLKRPADEKEVHNFKRDLFSKRNDRILILGHIRYSAEGKQHGVPVKGLALRYNVHRLIWLVRRIPVLGHVFFFVKDLFTITKKFDSVFYVKEELEQIRSTITDETGRLENQIIQTNGILQELQREKGERQEDYFEQQLLTEECEKVYLEFENRFRGSREEIKQRQKIYLDMVENLDMQNGHDNTNVLDLGCGRGEWLELLKEHQFIGRGIDLNKDMVNECIARKLQAVCGDALAYMRDLPDESYYMITGFQIMEHINSQSRLALLKESLRVLKKGGVAVFETPNPENLIVGACNFYMDPTHIRPIPPEQLRFMAQAAGFVQVDILRINPYQAIDEEKLFKENEELRKMAEFFNNMSDYSILAYKR